jgi:hypothetical protein
VHNVILFLERLNILGKPVSQKKLPDKTNGTLRPGFLDCSLNTPIPKPCREFFVAKQIPESTMLKLKLAVV